MDPTLPETHLAIMARMVLQAPSSKLGRTQLMKLCYFLQEIEGVPIRYDFRLFNYGPFDSEVLSDLGKACSRNTLKEQTVVYNRGYGYEITPGESAQQLNTELETSNPQLTAQIDRVVKAFAGDGAGELELKSTILFVDREFYRDGQPGSIDTISKRVHEVKPHFSEETIQTRIVNMNEKGWLNSLEASVNDN